ncbi:hypothetical protein AB1Y20_020922 [Prymnesium parvum]|uniref:Ion transport domain-containing protein n=1 Tax=Prymnesium parvum TaxID=97485 RepID=A0AB34JKK2_PRYPA
MAAEAPGCPPASSAPAAAPPPEPASTTPPSSTPHKQRLGELVNGFRFASRLRLLKQFHDDEAVQLCVAGYLGDLEQLRALARVPRRTSRACRTVDLGDYDGRTALHLASSEGKAEAVRVLVEELGADVNVLDRFGGTPLDDAVRHQRLRVQAYLREHGAVAGDTSLGHTETVAGQLCEAAAHGDVKQLRKLVQREFFNPSAKDYDARTALHLAASEGHLDVVKLLVEDFDVETSPVDRWDGTPLDDALRHHHDAIAAYLRGLGAHALNFSSLGEVGLEGDWGEGARAESRGGEATSAAGHLLCTAAAAGKPEELRRLVCEERFDVDACDYDKRTALHVAAADGQEEVLRMLVNTLGARTSPLDRWGQTPLDEARRFGKEGAVRFLESKEARSASGLHESKAGVEALFAAVSNGDVHRLRLLVEQQGVDVNLANPDGRTALHRAATLGRLTVVSFLLDELQCAPCPADRWGRTPLRNAIDARHDAVVALLTARGGAAEADMAALRNEVMHAGRLCQLAAAGKVEEVRALVLEEGVPVHIADYDARTALHVAAAKGQLRLVRVLLEELHADPNPADRWGSTPLDDAVRGGHSQLERYLKARRATKTFLTDANTDGSSSGRTVAEMVGSLCAAAFMGDLPALRALGASEAGRQSVNSSDYDKRTPLHIGASEGRPDVVQLLLTELHADPNVEDRWGGTPLLDAERRPSALHREAAEILRSAGARRLATKECLVPGLAVLPLTSVAYCASRGYAEGVRRALIQARCHGGVALVAEHLRARDPTHGNSPFHWAAYACSRECVALLVDTARRVLEAWDEVLEQRNYARATPLHLAARHNSAEVASFLLHARADPHAADASGSTPLHTCCRAGNAEVARRILQWATSGLETPTAAQETPLMAAVASGDAETVQVLLDADARFDLHKLRGKSHRVAAVAQSFIKAISREKPPARTRLRFTRTVRFRPPPAAAARWCERSDSSSKRRLGGGGLHASSTSCAELPKAHESGLDAADFLMAKAAWPGEPLLKLALQHSHFQVLKLLLYWGRRHHRGGTHPAWCRGIFSREEVIRILVHLWAPHDNDGLSQRETVDLFALLVFCVCPFENSLAVDGKYTPVSTIALDIARVCREHGLAASRDIELQQRLLTASAVLELLACGMIDAVSRLAAHAPSMKHARLRSDETPRVLQTLLEPTLEFAAAYECDIFLAMPMVLRKMRRIFSPFRAKAAARDERRHAVWLRAACLCVQLLVNLAALPFLFALPDGVATRLEVSFRAALERGAPAPFGLIWVLPPGKALNWLLWSVTLCGVLTFLPPDRGDAPFDGWDRHLADPFNLIDEAVALCLGGILACRLFGTPPPDDAPPADPPSLLFEAFNVTSLRVESSASLYASSVCQAVGAGLMFLRLMKVLYMLPQTGRLLLMAIHMLRDLRGFLVLLFFVLGSCVLMLYIWIRVSTPYLSSALVDGTTDLDAFFLTIYALLDEALVTGEPMFHEALANPARGKIRHTGELRAFLFCIGMYFYVIVALLLLNLLIARFSKSFSLVDERHDLNTALVFARVCLAPEYQELVPPPLSLIRHFAVGVYYASRYASRGALHLLRRTRRDDLLDAGPGDAVDAKAAEAPAAELPSGGQGEIAAGRQAAEFIQRAMAADVALFPEAAAAYALKHYDRVRQHWEYHQRLS